MSLPVLSVILTLAQSAVAAAINIKQDGPTSNRDAEPTFVDRSWKRAVQDINGMTSILTLVPVLTGKRQNVKLAASRVFPASAVLVGVGAGRGLAKLQLGILLCDFDLYRNTVDDLSSPLDEYINKFAPQVDYYSSNNADRHVSRKVEMHNLAETYMVEAWFRTNGKPARVTLRLNSWTRMASEISIYVILYAFETFLSAKNAAIGTRSAFIGIQAASVLFWISGLIILQQQRGQGKKQSSEETKQSIESKEEQDTNETQVNQTREDSPTLVDSSSYELPTNVIELNGHRDYHHFELPIYRKHVKSEVLSFHRDNFKKFHIFPAGVQQTALVLAGVLMMLSALLDILSTLLVLGFTTWAYPWLGYELLIIAAKVAVSIEPLRHAEIEKVVLQDGTEPEQNAVKRLPLRLEMAQPWTCDQVFTEYNLVMEETTGVMWQSEGAGIWYGQRYSQIESKDDTVARYLTLDDNGRLMLGLTQPLANPKADALQREFFTALRVVVECNPVPSKDFLKAVETSLERTKQACPSRSKYGSGYTYMQLKRASEHRFWRKYL